MIYSVYPENLDEVWPLVNHFITAALIHGSSLSTDDMKQRIRDGYVQLYVYDDGELKGAFTTEVELGGQKKILRCITLGGNDFKNWVDEVEGMLIEYANDIGAILQVIGRPGWNRLARQRGWKVASVIFEKESL